jgi:thiol-disulfide isomerase/thioredoxin
MKLLYQSLFERVGSAIGVQARLNDDGSSFSGNERDHLFLNDGGHEFHDLSGVSGLDSPADGRSLVVWDYDRDGRPDFAVTNSNHPRLQLYRNAVPEDGREVLAFRFIGGNTTAAPGPWSPRDAYGTRITVDLGDLRLERELVAGEGLAAQNSATLLVGIGRRPGAKAVRLTWPSGRVQELGEVKAGTLITAYEDAAQGPGGSALSAETYRRAAPSTSVRSPEHGAARTLSISHSGPVPRLRMYTTLATWCEACRKEIPQLHRLRAAFDEGALGMYGVAIDPEDGDAELRGWMAAHRPPYELLSGLGQAERAAVKEVVLAELKQEAVPATILTDRHGRILAAQWGPPTVSRIRELLRSPD